MLSTGAVRFGFAALISAPLFLTPAALGHVAEKMVGEDKGHHRFADGDGANADAGVVSALGQDLGLVALGVDRLARCQDRGCGLYRKSADDGAGLSRCPPRIPPAWFVR